MMNHCAKKLLGLAFALALCLAVGGTALAQTPVFADVPDAAFDAAPDPLPEELDDAFSVDPGGDADILLTR